MNGIRMRTVVEFVLAALLVGAGTGWFFFAPGEGTSEQESVAGIEDFSVQNQRGEMGEEMGTAKGGGKGEMGTTEVGDADGDGLPDWEERLRGTDPKRQDTDGDGTRDGDELRARRNPLQAGPDDALTEELRILAPAAISSFRFSFLADKNPSPYGYSLYERENKRAESQSGEEKGGKGVKDGGENGALHAYGNALGAPIQQATKDGAEELATLNKTIGKVSPETLAAVMALAAKYAALAENLNKVTVPPEAAQVHQSLAAAYAEYAAALRGFTATGADGKIPAHAFQTYSDATLAVGKAFIEIMQFFAARGIRFAQDEPGEIFNR